MSAYLCSVLLFCLVWTSEIYDDDSDGRIELNTCLFGPFLAPGLQSPLRRTRIVTSIYVDHYSGRYGDWKATEASRKKTGRDRERVHETKYPVNIRSMDCGRRQPKYSGSCDETGQ
jgi:hypothetical protein